MKKLLILLICTIFVSLSTYGQSSKEVIPKVVEDKQIEFHQLYLDRPAESIEHIQYTDGKLLEGELTSDGMRVIIKNYTKKGRVEVDVKYRDGSSDKISKSSCYIDPVAPS
jgi:antitoxin component YwqK of YwqJK toxin-antitoxin module